MNIREERARRKKHPDSLHICDGVRETYIEEISSLLLKKDEKQLRRVYLMLIAMEE